jgi:glycosyltransferase involved in cell wall biosynthesis
MGAKKKLDKRDQRPARTVTVVVPCTKAHVAHLPGLVTALRGQTRAPDQIVIAVSGGDVSELPILDAQVLHSTARQTAGANRNRGSDVALGDVVIYQDADDIPHPQRVEIIAGLFEKYEIEHLMHLFYHHDARDESFSAKEAAKRSRYRTAPIAAGITNGNPAVARSVWQAIRWPEYAQIGEDVDFNARIYAYTKRTVITELPLMTYRQRLSSFQ